MRTRRTGTSSLRAPLRRFTERLAARSGVFDLVHVSVGEVSSTSLWIAWTSESEERSDDVSSFVDEWLGDEVIGAGRREAGDLVTITQGEHVGRRVVAEDLAGA